MKFSFTDMYPVVRQLIGKRFSHVGRRPVTLEPGVSVEILPLQNVSKMCPFGTTNITHTVSITGKLGTLRYPIHRGLVVAIKPGAVPDERLLEVGLDNSVFPGLSRKCQRFVRSVWGTASSRLRQAAEGVNEGFQVQLRLVGVGYRASVDNGHLNLKVGYTNDLLLPIPLGIAAKIVSQNKVILSGCDLQKVTQFAAHIRSFRTPEPYNGRGIFVGDETIRLKEIRKK